MRRYETMIISDPDLSDEDRGQLFERITDPIAHGDGFLVFLDEWGDKKLAYDVKKKSRGFYVRIDYCGNGELVNEIERYCRINDNVLKYMTVLLDKDVDVDAVQEEIKNRKAAEAESEKIDMDKESDPGNDKPDSVTRDEENSSDAPEPVAADNEAEETEADEKE
ncbi:small subunit ribosomal protein S6 [Desulfosarcina sp. BuS5]|uniref:30S ribosomal protein S6 n=1 Tax=Desulfosarcina sp. BuS5 TaxID=933262 RepID=UPI00048411D7|nr:30S ribosomal protein S6 [Desulfosarcina sp. BuS5]WDN90819.1 small subunit ribosomal protein S6 [Desulfosarcina sp. BuS5]